MYTGAHAPASLISEGESMIPLLISLATLSCLLFAGMAVLFHYKNQAIAPISLLDAAHYAKQCGCSYTAVDACRLSRRIGICWNDTPAFSLGAFYAGLVYESCHLSQTDSDFIGRLVWARLQFDPNWYSFLR